MSLSLDDLKRLAVDIVEGRIFGSWMVESGDESLLGTIFLPLGLGGAGHLPEDTRAIYARMSEAMPRGINGYPMFGSCRALTERECTQLPGLIDAYESSRSQFLDDTATEPAPPQPAAGGMRRTTK